MDADYAQILLIVVQAMRFLAPWTSKKNHEWDVEKGIILTFMYHRYPYLTTKLALRKIMSNVYCNIPNHRWFCKQLYKLLSGRECPTSRIKRRLIECIEKNIPNEYEPLRSRPTLLAFFQSMTPPRYLKRFPRSYDYTHHRAGWKQCGFDGFFCSYCVKRNVTEDDQCECGYMPCSCDCSDSQYTCPCFKPGGANSRICHNCDSLNERTCNTCCNCTKCCTCAEYQMWENEMWDSD